MTDTVTTAELSGTARAVIDTRSAGRAAVIGRVVDIQGFSTWAGDELIVVDDAGAQHGQVLGAAGASAVRQASADLLARGGTELDTVVVEIHGAAVAEAGLSCGGRAELLLQSAATIPDELWDLLAGRAPAALCTPLGATGAPVASVVVAADGRTWGALDPPRPLAVAEAGRLLANGHSATRRVDDDRGTVLVEAWIPDPRLVVVGSGDLVGAIRAQAGLLGWETTALDGRPDPGEATETASWPALDTALDWAGSSAALVVLSHDPHVDVAALGAGIDRRVAYIGAMGSRRTQSRRLDRLAAAGRGDEELAVIHRPIGLDLGGRAAAEVALAICAEILAAHCGRDARPLSSHDGPINDRPAAAAR